MRRSASITAVSVFAVLGISACSPGGSTPAPSSTAETPSATAPSAPKVDKPKNLKSVTNACDLLTSDQLSQLGGDGKPEEDTSAYGETQCYWSGDAFAVGVSVNTTSGGPAKIQEAGSSRDNFEPTTVDGYPGARVDKQDILCRIELGVADDQSVEINYTKHSGGSPEMDDPCGFAEKITSQVLKNIPDA
ncbi:DUF3558 domain-containing protein [Saccharopolyspora sp. NPDC002376]